MTDIKHTPGPWIVEPGTALVWNESISHPVAEAKMSIGVKAFDRETIDANARLIAAAPDLLEALRRLINMYDAVIEGETNVRPSNHPDRFPEMWQALRAIAKAEGSDA